MSAAAGLDNFSAAGNPNMYATQLSKTKRVNLSDRFHSAAIAYLVDHYVDLPITIFYVMLVATAIKNASILLNELEHSILGKSFFPRDP